MFIIVFAFLSALCMKYLKLYGGKSGTAELIGKKGQQ